MTQDEALNILKTGANVFLTGEPGSGKTHTINQYVKWLRERGIEPSITASTGIAATHIGGYTIHSWSGIGIKKNLSPYDLDIISQNKRVLQRIGSSKILIIDEVSMLSTNTLSMVDAVCREVRRNKNEAFGGLQVVLVGDFFQLPPVFRDFSEKDNQTSFLESVSDRSGRFAFHSSSWRALNPLVCYLSEQWRQEDGKFLEFLLSIRQGETNDSHKELLRSRYSKESKGGITQLYSHNIDVDRINEQELAKISGPVNVFEMENIGPSKIVLGLKRGCLSPEILSLKIGARVMFTKNDHNTHKYVNGTIGVVESFSKETRYPVVKTESGARVEAEPVDWVLEDQGRTLAKITQIPLRLAWALTVHKSQGMSLDSAHMDLSGAFEYGQGYVALSRVRTLQGLSLSGLNKMALEVHPDVKEKDFSFKEDSSKVGAIFEKMNTKELEEMHHNFIRACGGNITPKEIHSMSNVEIKVKKDTLLVTRELLLKKLSLEEIAEKRKMTLGTIIHHLEELSLKKKIMSEDFEYLLKGKEDNMKKIEKSFDKLGTSPLKPIFEDLDGRISYETIRLARLLKIDARR